LQKLLSIATTIQLNRVEQNPIQSGHTSTVGNTLNYD
jgi:hypothetical protein